MLLGLELLFNHLIPHKQGQRDRGPLGLRLPRLILDLRVQSLGLFLRDRMLTETAPLKRALDQLEGRNSLGWIRPARPRSPMCPSPPPLLGTLPTIAWPASLPVWIPS